MVPVRETTPFIQPSKFGRVRQHTSINDTETRIVGGNPADLGEYPSFAFAVGGTLCGG
jgi:secreted trypsin-like serine protease